MYRRRVIKKKKGVKYEKISVIVRFAAGIVRANIGGYRETCFKCPSNAAAGVRFFLNLTIL